MSTWGKAPEKRTLEGAKVTTHCGKNAYFCRLPGGCSERCLRCHQLLGSQAPRKCLHSWHVGGNMWISDGIKPIFCIYMMHKRAPLNLTQGTCSASW